MLCLNSKIESNRYLFESDRILCVQLTNDITKQTIKYTVDEESCEFIDQHTFIRLFRLQERLLDCPLSAKQFSKLIRSINRSLNQRLKQPIKVERLNWMSTVTVMGSVTYEISYDLKQLQSFGLMDYYTLEEEEIPVSVIPLLITSYWLRYLIQQVAKQDIWSIVSSSEKFLTHLTDTILKALEKDDRYWEMKNQLLPEELNIDPDIIALVEFINDDNYIRSNDYSRVWQHKKLYQQLYDEKSYLRLMDYAIKDGLWRKYSEDSKGLKDYFLDKGISPTGWHYICHYGDCLFKELWATQSSGNYLQTAQKYLSVLEKAGCPSLPSSQFQKIWFSVYADSFNSLYDECNIWENIPEQILKIIFNHLYQQNELNDELLQQLEKILQWIEEVDPILDHNQIKSGWQWLSKKSNEWYQSTIDEMQINHLIWDPILTIKDDQLEGFIINELTSGYQLFEASVLMRNCLDGFTDECMNNEKRFFTVYENEQKKRPLAAIGLSWSENKEWTVYEVKGFANQPVESIIIELAHKLCQKCLPFGLKDQKSPVG